jgi:transposase
VEDRLRADAGHYLRAVMMVHTLLPQQAAEARRQAAQVPKGIRLSRTAQRRLKVVAWHEAHGRNVSLSARHFSHSRTTMQSWLKRYKAGALTAFEDKTRRPHNVRQPTWSAELEERVLELREHYPRWDKDKLVVLLRREGRLASTSMVGRILTRLKATSRLVEPLPERCRRKRGFVRPYAIRSRRAFGSGSPVTWCR